MEETSQTKDLIFETAKQLLNERFDRANKKTFTIIEDFISGGYEQMLAELLAYLPEERKAQALEMLPPELRVKVSQILEEHPDMKNDSADVLSAAGYVLKKADFYGEKSANEVIQKDDILLTAYMEHKNKMLYAENPLLSMNLEAYMINMDILLYMDDRSIQKFLREVDSMEIAMALKGTNKEVRDKIYRNMSRRAAAMLQEDMEFMGPVRKIDVLEAQRKCIEIIRRLEEMGEIVISVFGTSVYEYML